MGPRMQRSKCTRESRKDSPAEISVAIQCIENKSDFIVVCFKSILCATQWAVRNNYDDDDEIDIFFLSPVVITYRIKTKGST